MSNVKPHDTLAGSPRNINTTSNIMRLATLSIALSALTFFHANCVARTSAVDMYEACQNFRKVSAGEALPPNAMQSAGICMGFIEGASEALYLGAAAGSGVKESALIPGALRKAGVVYACLPVDNLKNLEKLEIFMRYFEKYGPAIKQASPAQGSALNVLMLALGDAYPCK